jgi:hypothetical protein
VSAARVSAGTKCRVSCSVQPGAGLGWAEGQDTKASLFSCNLPRDRVHDVDLFPNLGVAGVDDVE